MIDPTDIIACNSSAGRAVAESLGGERHPSSRGLGNAQVIC